MSPILEVFSMDVKRKGIIYLLSFMIMLVSVPGYAIPDNQTNSSDLPEFVVVIPAVNVSAPPVLSNELITPTPNLNVVAIAALGTIAFISTIFGHHYFTKAGSNRDLTEMGDLGWNDRIARNQREFRGFRYDMGSSIFMNTSQNAREEETRRRRNPKKRGR